MFISILKGKYQIKANELLEIDYYMISNRRLTLIALGSIMLLLCAGGLIQPTPSRLLRITVKKDFVKI